MATTTTRLRLDPTSVKMTTWAQPIRHPWFNPPSTKRKLFIHDDDDDDFSSGMSPVATPTCRRKRVRHDSLERTMAHMTLTTPPEDVGMWPKISLTCPRERETLSVVLPSAVEEPDTLVPELADNAMEVESVEGTNDATCVREWDTMASDQLDIKEVHISSAVLDCFWRQTKCPTAPIPLPSQTSQALVLYRACPPLSTPLEQVLDDQEGKSTSVHVTHEDVMEVE